MNNFESYFKRKIIEMGFDCIKIQEKNWPDFLVLRWKTYNGVQWLSENAIANNKKNIKKTFFKEFYELKSGSFNIANWREQRSEQYKKCTDVGAKIIHCVNSHRFTPKSAIFVYSLKYPDCTEMTLKDFFDLFKN